MTIVKSPQIENVFRFFVLVICKEGYKGKLRVIHHSKHMNTENYTLLTQCKIV